MAKEENNFTVDSSIVESPKIEVSKTDTKKSKKKVIENEGEEQPLINCLRNERVIIRYINKTNNKITNPKHVLYGGMAENATRTFVVPMLSSGRYVNVLTDSEKNFLEDIMGLEHNALSIYKKVDNFWDDSKIGSVAKITLRKQDNYLDLSNPEEYIKYKILLANKDFIAPSLEELETSPKATYQFVIINEDSEAKAAKSGMTLTMKCYSLYGKLEDNTDALRLIIETISGVKVHPNTKKDFLQAKIHELIQGNTKMFYKIASDPLLQTKVLIKKSIEAGLIAQRGNQYYIRNGNVPMCEQGEPTLNVAAQWINLPKNQTYKLSLEAGLN